ncbi:hypothetical protein MAR_019114, partial [Mya arenaria]
MKNAGILYLLLELTLLPPFCETCMSQRYCLERWNDVSEKAGFKEWYHVTPNHSFILCGIYKNASDCIDDVKQIGRKGIQEKESAKHQKDSWIKETPTNEDKSDSCPKAVEDSNIDRHRNKSVESISKSNINNGSITGNITIINGNAIYSTKRSPRFCRCRNVINHENIESDGIGADMDHSPAIERHESSIEEIVSWSGWRRTLNEFCQRWKNRDLEIAKDVTRRLYIDYFSDLSNPEIYGLRTYFDRLNTGIPMTQEEQRQFEWLRFVSFYQYQGNGNGIALARNGFCHNPEDGPNSTHCFACDARYNEWEMFDNVVEIHTRLSPNCPLLHGNIGEGTRRNISIVSDDVPRRRPAQQQTAVTAEPTGRNVQDSQPARSTSSSSAAAAATSGASSVSSVAATSTTSSAGSFIHSHLPSQSRNPIATSLTRVSGLGNFGRPVPTTTQQVTVPSSAKPESPFSAPSTSASAIASSASAVGGIAASVADTHISSGSQHSGFTSMQPTSDPNNTDRMYHLNPTTQIRGMGMVDEPYNEISVPPPQQGISGQPQSMPVSGHTQVSELRSSSVPLVQGLSGSPGLTPHQEARPPPPSTQQALSYQQRGQGLGGGSGPGDAPPDRARGTGLPGLDPDLTAGIHIVSPRHPDYNTLTARINSFSGWPSHLDQNPRMMGEAGFFYVAENNSQDPLDCETGRQLMSMGFPQARTRRAIRALRITH